nr:hypothetical protein [Tanacetum cinerariifolium]
MWETWDNGGVGLEWRELVGKMLAGNSVEVATMLAILNVGGMTLLGLWGFVIFSPSVQLWKLVCFTEGVEMDDGFVDKESTDDSVTSLEQLDESGSSRNECSKSRNENKSSNHESTSSGNDVDDDIGPSYESDTMSEGLGFENKNDVENPSLLNKAKELAPHMYNIDEIGKDLLSHHKIISEEELECEAEKYLKVKQRKSPLSYHGFVYGEPQFEEPPKVHL